MHKNAFTLIELLITLSILGLFVMMAVPSYQTLMKRHHADATMQQLYRAIQLARIKAIKYHRTASLCPTIDYKHCTNNKDWNLGYMIFIDQQHILHLFSPITKNGQLFFKGFPDNVMLQMTKEGFTNHQNGTFYYCPKDHDARFARALFIIQSGRMRFSTDKNHDGVHEDSLGKPLRCF